MTLHGNICSRCGDEPRRPGNSWGRDCHAAYMREWRKTHPMSEEQRRKDIARSYVSVYLRRGKLERQPCEVCGATDGVEAHHDDYDQPLDVRWLCGRHHRLEHAA